MTSRFHRMWGVTVFQKNFCIFSVFKAKPKEWWLYVRHKVEDCPYLIGKMTHDGIQESENMPYPVYSSWKGEKKGQFYFLGSMLQEYKIDFYKKVQLAYNLEVGLKIEQLIAPKGYRDSSIPRVEKARKLRKKGKSYRQISKETDDTDIKTIWRWLHTSV